MSQTFDVGNLHLIHKHTLYYYENATAGAGGKVTKVVEGIVHVDGKMGIKQSSPTTELEVNGDQLTITPAPDFNGDVNWDYNYCWENFGGSSEISTGLCSGGYSGLIGKMDDVSIWNQALTQGQILANINSEILQELQEVQGPLVHPVLLALVGALVHLVHLGLQELLVQLDLKE